ncbi:sarcosine oxidase subunit delta [Kocuria carniphila]|uniref:sarcosine oxidase subunit delta n=1 Tax=Kocuria carniphila TaxID=262208 RepID=UPI0028E37964|nr:sarcosine oxidase subunit delta [Kocuria carniphila]
MLLIECPYCGPRNETEYHYGGEAHVPYPQDPFQLTDQQWAEYLFYRSNPKGLIAERWVHSAGCRRWFNAVRDTVTYEIKTVYRVGDPRPSLDDHPAQTTTSTTSSTSTTGTSSTTPTGGTS